MADLIFAIETSCDETAVAIVGKDNKVYADIIYSQIKEHEPFAGVDPIAVEEIQGIVHSLKEKEIGVLITDHNVRETLSITDRSYLLFKGQILKSGTSEFLANDEEARRLYLGEKFKLD